MMSHTEQSGSPGAVQPKCVNKARSYVRSWENAGGRGLRFRDDFLGRGDLNRFWGHQGQSSFVIFRGKRAGVILFERGKHCHQEEHLDINWGYLLAEI